ncbi:MAG: class I SAM-dependent methyltransferase [Dissulfurispiraceae bacterium]
MREFWESQAEKFKEGVQAVNFDPLAEELELFFLEGLIGDGDIFCDMGCGNGRTLMTLAAKRPKAVFYGVDFAKGMIETANAKKEEMSLPNVHFYHFDAASKDLSSLLDARFDKVMTKRLLINLKGNEKLKAVENAYSVLKDNGTYIMIECFTEPLLRINEIRATLELNEIKVKFFNEYLSFDILEKINDLFRVEKRMDFASLYYFISRVFNAALSQGEPDYFSDINRLAVELTKKGFNPIEGYSPEIMFALKKNNEKK